MVSNSENFRDRITAIWIIRQGSLRITCGGIFVVSRDVELVTSRDGQVSVPLSVARSDLRSLGVKGNGNPVSRLVRARSETEGLYVLSARLCSLGFSCVVNHGLMVWYKLVATDRWTRSFSGA